MNYRRIQGGINYRLGVESWKSLITNVSKKVPSFSHTAEIKHNIVNLKKKKSVPEIIGGHKLNINHVSLPS